MINPREVQSILLIRPSALGDVCRTVPVLVALREAWPEARVDWMVREGLEQAVTSHPALTRVWPFPRQRFRRMYRPSVARAIWQWGWDLRKGGYDLVLDCQGLLRSGIMSWVTRARWRVGSRQAREMGWLGYSIRHDQPHSMHSVDQMLDLLVAIGLEVPSVPDMRLYVAEADRDWWAGEETGMSGKRYAVIAPTSRWLDRRWPAERFRELAMHLPDVGIEGAVLLGAPGEEQQAAPILEGTLPLPVTSLVGETSIGQSMAVIERAACVIAHDSGPLHMAVGLGCPCLGLYGPTNPALTGPYRQPASVITPPGDDRYRFTRRRRPLSNDNVMERLSVTTVMESLAGVLAVRQGGMS